jgi:predicted transcriptional regulator
MEILYDILTIIRENEDIGFAKLCRLSHTSVTLLKRSLSFAERKKLLIIRKKKIKKYYNWSFKVTDKGYWFLGKMGKLLNIIQKEVEH